MRLEFAAAGQLDTLVALDAACFDPPWSTQSWQGEVDNDHTHQFLGRNGGGDIVAYASVSVVAGEAEIRRIAVMPEHRRQGHGRAFLDRVLEELRAQGAQRVFLEVRASNAAARRLYATAGFAEDRIRAAYYRAPTEDGVDLSREL